VYDETSAVYRITFVILIAATRTAAQQTHQNSMKQSNLCTDTKQLYQSVCVWTVDMGGMSDYDIWPKPKVWVGSANEC